MQRKQAKDSVLAILHHLNNLNGFDGWWESIDSDIQEEITEELTAIVEKVFSGSTS